MDNENQIEIVPMSLDDVATVKNLEKECGLSFWSESAYFEELKRADSIALVAKKVGEVIGFIIARLITTELEDCELEIYNIAVSRELRRKGRGKALIVKCLEVGQMSGCSKVWLEVRESNWAAIEFYQKNGFEILYKRKNFYHSPVEDALVMSFKFENLI